MSEAILNILTVALIVLSALLAFGAISALAEGEALTGVLLLLLLGAIAFAHTQLA